MNLSVTQADIVKEAKARLAEAAAIAENPNATAEDNEKFVKLTAEIKALQAKAASMGELARAAADLDALHLGGDTRPAPGPAKWKTLGEMALAIHGATFRGRYDPRLAAWSDPNEPATTPFTPGWSEQDAKARKDLVENVGASGGFLVPVDQRNELLLLPQPDLIVRPRARIIPIRARQVQWPVLDQTNTTSGRPAWFGGVLAHWTEEGAYKSESDPQFRQINLVAHKLVCLTEASDELLADSAISLEALLQSMFNGAINWYEEEAFVNGTGAGQPLGVINAGATFVQGRAVVGAIGLVDIINMLEHSYGNPVWLISRSALPSLMQLNGPAGNPSYVFMPNARDGMPGTLMGYPVFWCEHCPLIGNRGDIILADWRYYLVADRQATTIDSSKHDKFRYDLTVWRAVHRVDGQPWLSQPLRYSDGTTQVSPFVILDAATGS